MRAEDRRELILQAATTVFGDHGYDGTTTAQVARAAGVSQPYVVRVFGTKEKLFLAVLHRALDRLLVAFRTALADTGSGVLVLVDIGSAVLSVRALLAGDDLDGIDVRMADAPLVEGAISASVMATTGADLAATVAAAEEARDVGKL